MNRENVLSTKQLCIGCGICAGICGKEAIVMGENEYGQYFPIIDELQCVSCGKCIAVCPMRISEKERKQIDIELWNNRMQNEKYRQETGFYINAYEGFFPKYRMTSASGGFCSALLCALLEYGMIQSIYCISKNHDSNNFFVSKRITSCNDVLKCSGSAYYPIELSETLKEIKKRNEKTAIVCLPCQATALRYAMKKDKALQDSIQYIIGLICGGVPGKSMVEYIAKTKGCELDEFDKITFREKDSGIQANNCQIKFYKNNHEVAVSRYHHGDAYGFVYLNKILHYKGCNICADIYAEQADIVFGDAWFDENRTNEWGTSICITRNRDLDDIMKKLGAKESSIDRMILAQRNVGLIYNKKKLAYQYKETYRKHGYALGEYTRKDISWKLKIIVFLRELMADANRKEWKKYKEGRITFNQLNKNWHTIIKWKKRIGL